MYQSQVAYNKLTICLLFPAHEKIVFATLQFIIMFFLES